MKERVLEVVKAVKAAVWSHRAVYAGLAGAYGAGCLGVLDKEAVQQVVTGLYVVLVAQRGH